VYQFCHSNLGLGIAGAFSHTNRREAVDCFQGIVGVAVHYFFVFDFASLHVGRGIDMGSRHDDFLM